MDLGHILMLMGHGMRVIGGMISRTGMALSIGRTALAIEGRTHKVRRRVKDSSNGQMDLTMKVSF